MPEDLDRAQAMKSVPKSWDERVRDIQLRTGRKAATLMWAGFGVYGTSGISIFIIFGDRPMAGYLVMFFFQLCVLWFGTRRMYQKFATSTELMIEAGRDSEDSQRNLSSAAEDMRKIRERVDRDTKPLNVLRRTGSDGEA